MRNVSMIVDDDPFANAIDVLEDRRPTWLVRRDGILHVHREVIHHGAEISLLRDLYLWKGSRGHL
jgi:hypothetical protein